LLRNLHQQTITSTGSHIVYIAFDTIALVELGLPNR
jgi:hypothetical protein